MIHPKVHTEVKGQEDVEKLMRTLEKCKDAYVSIGLHEDAGSYPSGESVVEVGLWNEFGTKHTPERSFIRSTVDENLSKIEAMRDKVINNMLTQGWTPEQALAFLGTYIQNLIQNKIKSNVPPPYGTGRGTFSSASHMKGRNRIIRAEKDRVKRNQEQKRKEYGHIQTLRASELMYRSVTFKVVMGGK